MSRHCIQWLSSAQQTSGQRRQMYVRSSFTVVNLHDLRSNYLRSIWHVIDLVYEMWGQPGGKPKFWGQWPHAPHP